MDKTRGKTTSLHRSASSQGSQCRTGMLDNGANVVCTNEETAAALGKRIQYYDEPVKINFGGVREVISTTYANFGTILGDVAIVENLPQTLVPAVPFLDRGFATIY